jgi:hypothetical protein
LPSTSPDWATASSRRRSVFGFDAGAVGFEDLAVGFVGAQRLLVGQQEVTGVTVLDVHDVADGAQLLDAFEENDLHGSSPLLDEVGQQPHVAGALDGLASSRCFLAETAVMRLGTILPRSDMKP